MLHKCTRQAQLKHDTWLISDWKRHNQRIRAGFASDPRIETQYWICLSFEIEFQYFMHLAVND